MNGESLAGCGCLVLLVAAVAFMFGLGQAIGAAVVGALT